MQDSVLVLAPLSQSDCLPQQCKGSALVARSNLPLLRAQEFFSNIIDVNEIYTVASMN